MFYSLNFFDVIHWIPSVFPSLSQYIKIVTPTAIMIITGLGVFSDILPSPGNHYLVPDIEDIDAELKENGKITYLLARMTRSITIKVNQFIDTRFYSNFYRFTKFSSTIIRKMRGQKNTSGETLITKPKPYVFKKFRKKNDEQ